MFVISNIFQTWHAETQEASRVKMQNHHSIDFQATPFFEATPQKLISPLPTLVHESLIRLNNLFSPCLHHLPKPGTFLSVSRVDSRNFDYTPIEHIPAFPSDNFIVFSAFLLFIDRRNSLENSFKGNKKDGAGERPWLSYSRLPS